MKALIAGDVGGTKTILALFSAEKGPHEPLVRKTYPSTSYARFDDILEDFLKQTGAEVALAVFGVAGPREGNIAHITNLSWMIDTDLVSASFGIKQICLLNDLESIAHGVSLLNLSDLHVLNKGEPAKNGPIGVIAPGTGLGESYLTWDGSRYLAHASEGGHTDFAPANAREIKLLEYLMDLYGHVSFERVCSGSGVPNIYRFLRDKYQFEEPAWLKEEMKEASDQTALIINSALNVTRPCDLSRETLHMFISILGSETGNLALKLLPSGGIYLGGGIPPKILNAIEGGGFMNAFLQKGRLTRIIARMPIYVILNTDVGLIGSAGYGMDILKA
jgi:glucokinase